LTADLARDRRGAADIGRLARLELVFARRSGRTVLADTYAEPPFRVGPCFPEADGLHMILAWAAPGIFGGDSFEQVIRLEQGARVRLTSQSALQVHPSAGHHPCSVRLPFGRPHGRQPDRDCSSVRLEPDRDSSSVRLPFGRPHGRQPDLSEVLSTYHVADDASLHCHWDPLIPFAHARFNQRIEVHLADSARLYWSDAFMAGRAFADRRSLGFGGAGAPVERGQLGFGGTNVGTGERWAFASLGHELRITRDETLEYLERYRIDPAERKVAHPWVAGDACYFGTTVRSGDATSVSDAERLHAELSSREGVRGATDAVSTRLWITRIMGTSGVPFHEARRLAKAHMSL
jgi:urease accessory protein UreH